MFRIMRPEEGDNILILKTTDPEKLNPSSDFPVGNAN